MLPLLVLLAAVWGAAFPMIRIVERAGLSPLGVTLLRFEIAGLAAAAILAAFPRFRVPVLRRDVPGFLLLGAMSVPAYHLPLNVGIQWTGANVAALIVLTNPIWTAVILTTVLHEPATRLQLGGIGMGFAGTVLVLFGAGGASLSLQALGGAALILISPLSWAAYTVIGRRYLPRYTPAGLALYALLFGTVLVLPLALVTVHEVRALPAVGWAGILYLGLISTTVANVIWYAGLEARGALRLTVFIYLMPAFAILFSWVLLGEGLSLVSAAGAPLIIAGIAIANRRPAPPPATTGQADPGHAAP